ncbi:DUF447 domain-containing protein [Palaeococcus ferrophilus]|uniref:DUF447 domain-containing protein n=1 Tax=Palaeococcus ferrophilus TaxID=83868 RepID=UPI00064F64C3|nr:DUF447 domain-containing protein [Palaeococcus ferrophilus]
MIDLFTEGQVYEVLLVTRSNVTPVGVVREGEMFRFKLFGGKSAAELRELSYAVLHVTNDVELLVKTALNMEVGFEFEDAETVPIKRIRGLPSIEGRVEWVEREWEDELGKTAVLECAFTPLHVEAKTLPPRPLSRADYALLEMAVELTRLLAALKTDNAELIERYRQRVEDNYRRYRRFGGRSPLVEEMRSMLHTVLG